MKSFLYFISLFAGLFFLSLIIIPILAVLMSTPLSDLLGKITSSSIQEPLRLSLITASISTGVVFCLATPVSYALAHKDFFGKRIVDALIDLPIVFPPAVAGLALLLAFAPNGIVGSYFFNIDIIIPGTIWAVIIAQIFVSSPFYYRSSKTAFELVDRRVEDSARILTKSDARIFLKITLPLAKRGILSGLIMTWARALGEFGATLMFAGNLPGVTQTMPLAIYMAMGSDVFTAKVLSVILLIFSLVILVSFRVIGGERKLL
jgi:molybdate transport system permease protein